MLLIQTELKDSGIHGLGVFAKDKIKKGEAVWRFDPVFDLKLPCDTEYAPIIQDMLSHYGYTVEEDGMRFFVLCGDNARFMNHSERANTLSSEDDPYTDIATLDIEAGEEITCNYKIFDLGWEKKIVNPNS